MFECILVGYLILLVNTYSFYVKLSDFPSIYLLIDIGGGVRFLVNILPVGGPLKAAEAVLFGAKRIGDALFLCLF